MVSNAKGKYYSTKQQQQEQNMNNDITTTDSYYNDSNATNEYSFTFNAINQLIDSISIKNHCNDIGSACIWHVYRSMVLVIKQ